jgi:hypothetical protein
MNLKLELKDKSFIQMVFWQMPPDFIARMTGCHASARQSGVMEGILSECMFFDAEG